MNEKSWARVADRDIHRDIASRRRTGIDRLRAGIRRNRNRRGGTSNSSGRSKRRQSAGYVLTGCVIDAVKGIETAEGRIQRVEERGFSNIDRDIAASGGIAIYYLHFKATVRNPRTGGQD